MRSMFAGLIGSLTLAVVLPQVASASATADQAQAMSEKASSHIVSVGEQQAFADFTAGSNGFKEGELYVFCYDPAGNNLAHGGNASLVGKNLIGMKDPDGVQANAEIIKKGMNEGRGWVDFKWVNPVSNKVEPKSAYVIRTNDSVCGVGYYH